MIGRVRSPFFGNQLDAGVERDQPGRRVLSRVGVGDAAADRGDVADTDGGHGAVDVGQQGRVLLDQRRGLDVTVARQAADVQAVGFLPDAVEASYAAEADDVVGVDQRLLHEHDERRSTGHRAAVILVLVEQRKRFIEGGRRVEVEVAH